MFKDEKWDSRFMAIAKEVSAWSKDPNTAVGAVVANGKHLTSVGYNGLPPGVEDSPERLLNRERKLAVVIHAEENALINSKCDVRGFTLYVYPLPPCERCASKIIAYGIKRVVSPEIPADSRWKESVENARELFREAGVIYEVM